MPKTSGNHKALIALKATGKEVRYTEKTITGIIFILTQFSDTRCRVGNLSARVKSLSQNSPSSSLASVCCSTNGRDMICP